MSASVKVEVVDGPSSKVAWTQNLTAQQALEAAYNKINSSATFTYAIQYYGTQLWYLVVMINETYDSFISSAAPFFYWEFLLNGRPAKKGIDSTILNANDTIEFSFQRYDPAKHKGSSLEAKHRFNIRATSSRK